MECGRPPGRPREEALGRGTLYFTAEVGTVDFERGDKQMALPPLTMEQPSFPCPPCFLHDAPTWFSMLKKKTSNKRGLKGPFVGQAAGKDTGQIRCDPLGGP